MNGHSIEWTFEDGSITGKPKCHEPEDADCRLVGMAGCECEQYNIERDEFGPFHMDDGLRHNMAPAAWCNVVEWRSEMDSYDLLEACQAKTAFQIGTTQIEPIWDGDGYSWEPHVGARARLCGLRIESTGLSTGGFDCILNFGHQGKCSSKYRCTVEKR